MKVTRLLLALLICGSACQQKDSNEALSSEPVDRSTRCENVARHVSSLWIEDGRSEQYEMVLEDCIFKNDKPTLVVHKEKYISCLERSKTSADAKACKSAWSYKLKSVVLEELTLSYAKVIHALECNDLSDENKIDLISFIKSYEELAISAGHSQYDVNAIFEKEKINFIKSGGCD